MSYIAALSATTTTGTENVANTSAEVDAVPETVLITEQEVLFATRVAVSAPKLSVARRLFDSVRNTARAVHLPPPHQHYPADMGYLEHSRMAREMDRL